MSALTLELIALHVGSAVVIVGVTVLVMFFYLACEDLWGGE